MPFNPTADEILKGLDCVYYEMQQLLAMMGPTIGVPVLDNAVVESRLVHVRTLLDFFGSEKRMQDDVLASDYGFGAAQVDIESIYVERLNKDLAHLTYSRTRREMSGKGWPAAKVVVPVLARCQEFIDHVIRERSVFGEVGPTDWRALQVAMRNYLESQLAGHGV